MTLTYGTKSQSTGTTASNNSPNYCSFTCAANTALLVLCLTGQTTTYRTGGAPQYNTSAFTLVRSIAGAAECTAELWYMSKPPTGSAYAIVTSNTGNVNLRAYACSFVSDVGSATTLDGAISSPTTVANPSLTLTGVTAGSAWVNILGTGNTAPPTARGPGVLLYGIDEGAWANEANYSITTAGGTVIASYTVVSDDVANILASFKEYTPTVGGASSRGFMTMRHIW